MLDNFDYVVKKIDTGQILENHVTGFKKYPSILRTIVKYFLRALVREKAINDFLEAHKYTRNFDFIDVVFNKIKIDCHIKQNEIQNIPARGRVLVVANHPLGGIDGLTLLRVVGMVRRDVRIVANNILMSIDPLEGLMLPVNSFSGNTRKADIDRIRQALENDEAVIIFPSGEVSRAGAKGIRDRSWLPGFLKIAEKTSAPILPIFVKGRNSALFYLTSRVSQVASMLLLPREMLNYKGKIELIIGQSIEAETLFKLPLQRKQIAQLVSKHLRSLGSKKAPVFETKKSIIHPVERQSLRNALQKAEQLGETADGKKILLAEYDERSPIMDEIGRLREMTFRAVGEGTGKQKDLDHYDRYYRHLILWDDASLEIAGAYRLGEVWRWSDQSPDHLYSSSLFEYKPNMKALLNEGLELGRSFVQPQYWGLRSLDYLWQGIGAYLHSNQEVRYLFGPVSLSSSLPKSARDLLIHFYKTNYPDQDALVKARIPYVVEKSVEETLKADFPGHDLRLEQDQLKERLEYIGVKIPTLFKQYSELCQPGGVKFCGFSIDPGFNHCVDGFIVVDLEKVKEKKRARYIRNHKDEN